jgi:hypothetical protein
VQFGTPSPLAGSFENGFCFIYCLNSFGGTIG